MIINLSRNVLVRRVTADGTNFQRAAGTDGAFVHSAAVDLQGFDSVMFIAAAGAIAGTGAIAFKVQQSNDSGGSPDDFTDLANSSHSFADADDNKILVIDVVKPTKRFVRLSHQRTTANGAIDSVLAILYNARNRPVAVDSNTDARLVIVSPAEG